MINKQASNLEGGQLGFTWADIPAGETCQAATHGGTGDRTLQVEGVFGGATVLLEGSLNGTDYHTLHDTVGVELAFTSAGLRAVLENVIHIRPSIVGGDGTTLINVTLAVRR